MANWACPCFLTLPSFIFLHSSLTELFPCTCLFHISPFSATAGDSSSAPKRKKKTKQTKNTKTKTTEPSSLHPPPISSYRLRLTSKGTLDPRCLCPRLPVTINYLFSPQIPLCHPIYCFESTFNLFTATYAFLIRRQTTSDLFS